MCSISDGRLDSTALAAGFCRNCGGVGDGVCDGQIAVEMVMNIATVTAMEMAMAMAHLTACVGGVGKYLGTHEFTTVVSHRLARSWHR